MCPSCCVFEQPSLLSFICSHSLNSSSCSSAPTCIFSPSPSLLLKILNWLHLTTVPPPTALPWLQFHFQFFVLRFSFSLSSSLVSFSHLLLCFSFSPPAPVFHSFVTWISRLSFLSASVSPSGFSSIFQALYFPPSWLQLLSSLPPSVSVSHLASV